MPKIGQCEECGATDILGFMACQLRYLCPKCSARIIEAPEQMVRDNFLRLMEKVKQDPCEL